jgi:hypothetical protein
MPQKIAMGLRERRDKVSRRRGVVGVFALILFLASPSAGQGQVPGKLPKIGVLEPYAATDPGYRVAHALRDVGIVEGRDILVEWRYAESHVERIPTLATTAAGNLSMGRVCVRRRAFVLRPVSG